MTDMDVDVRGELFDLARSLRAHLEWQLATGASALPRSPVLLAADRMPPPVHLPLSVEVSSALAGELETSAAPGTARAGAAPAAAPTSAGASQASQAPPAVLNEGARGERLRLLAETVSGCTRCGLSATRKQTVFARGNGSSGLCFIGEGPGADEDAQGLPFVGAAGQLLDRMIVAMGLSRDEVYVCNIVKCRPPDNRKPEAEEMAACVPYLAEQIELIAPQVLVALGATAVLGLLGTNEGITRLRGKWKLYRGRIAVMPTFHPAYLLRNPAAKREVWEDLQAVLRQMGRSAPERAR